LVEGLTDFDAELAHGERLLEQRRNGGVAGRGESGDEQDWLLGFKPTNLFSQPRPGHSGHLDVGDDQVEALAALVEA
jgi:hypothetical protein